MQFQKEKLSPAMEAVCYLTFSVSFRVIQAENKRKHTFFLGVPTPWPLPILETRTHSPSGQNCPSQRHVMCGEVTLH